MKKQDFKTRIISNKEVAENFYRMELSAAGVTFQPGEFFQISVPSHTLRRPFAPSYSDNERFAYTYQIVGEGTEILSKLPCGTELSVIAPLGNGFTLPSEESTAILVGGGCGTPSLALLARKLAERKSHIYSIIGARSCNTILERDTLGSLSKRLIITTDDGSEGIRGNVVDGIKSILTEVKNEDKEINIFSCGPVPMLKGVAALAEAEGIKAELSFEERMACGFGACMGCAIKINSPESAEGYIYKRVCQDGPVFASTEIYW